MARASCFSVLQVEEAVKQSDILMESEGNCWLERNRSQLGKRDPVCDLIGELGIVPKSVLEVGAANGWRLKKLRDRYGCVILGVDPSMQAYIEASRHAIPMFQATADALPARPDSFDLVIYGFCLYLTDPADWLKIAAEGDRVLKSGGHLIVHDFAEPTVPFARRYKHRDGLLAYHVDFADLWLGHPLYSASTRRIDGDEMVTVLKKLPVDRIQVLP